MNNTVIVLSRSEDSFNVEQLHPDQFTSRLDDEYYGSNPVFHNQLPEDSNPERWDLGLWIIKNGQLVVPKAKAKVVSWEV